MTIATDWQVTVSVNVNAQAKFDCGSVKSATSAAKRTNAKFLFACGMQLITLLVMLTRALSKQLTFALSAYTARVRHEFESAQS